MKKLVLTLFSLAALAGCSTDRGGTAGDYNTQTDRYTYPEPPSPPTFRPGMNPEDIRDPTSVTRPGPSQVWPANPQWGVPGPGR